MQSQQLRRFALDLTKICEAKIKTPLTTRDKDEVANVSFSTDETASSDRKILKPSAAAPLLFCREVK
jgi:hypothetical protein